MRFSRAARFAFWMALAVVVPIGCRDDRLDGLEELAFTVDKGRLGAESSIREIGVRFSAPIGWKEQTGNILDAAKLRVDQLQGDGPRLELLRLYAEPHAGVACAVSRLIDASAPIPDQFARIESAAKKAFPDATIRRGVFRKKRHRIHQLRIESPERIHFKLVFDDGKRPPFQADYMIPRAVYEAQLRAVESSIGSFRSSR